MSNMDINEDIKTKRSNCKRNVTRLITKLDVLIKDMASHDDVKSIMAAIDENFLQFKEAHDHYVQQVEDNSAQGYFDTVKNDVNEAIRRANVMLDVKEKRKPTHSEDSSSLTHPSGSNVSTPTPRINTNEELVQRLEELEQKRDQEQKEFQLKLEQLQKDSDLLKMQLNRNLADKEESLKVHMEESQQSNEFRETSTPARQINTRASFGVSSIHEQTTAIADAIRSVLEESRLQQRAIVNSIYAPRIELFRFDGSPMKYHPFIRNFENVVEAKIEDNSVRLDTLLQYCSEEVKTYLQCCLLKNPEEGYQLARKLLKERYGDEETIASAWLEKILSRPRIKDIKDLQSYAMDLKTCHETLLSMNYLSELQTKANLKAITNKLPDSIYSRWVAKNYDIAERTGRHGNLKELIAFIERIATNNSVFPERHGAYGYSSQKQMNATEIRNGKQPNYKCPKCKDNHFLNQCPEFRALNVQARRDFVNRERLCENCFHTNHDAKSCPRNWTCNVNDCGAKHNRWLHPVSKSISMPNDDTSINNTTVAATSINEGTIQLPIASVLVIGPSGKMKRVNALFDTGSNGSMCSESLVKELDLNYEISTATLSTVDRGYQTIKCKLVDLEVRDLLSEYTFKMSKVMTRNTLNITADAHITHGELAKWSHLADLDISHSDRNQVDLLIGQDHSALLMPLEVRKGKDHEPFAIKTRLGWIINGSLSATKQLPKYTMNFIDSHLDQQVEKFWTLDDTSSLGKVTLSTIDKQVVDQWESGITTDDRNYSLPIPFKQKPPGLPNNRMMAENRLKSLAKRLEKDPALKEKYVASIQESLTKGYAEKVEDTNQSPEGSVWYLPHHPVTHPRKPDKVRVVFDCASKFQGVSLNDKVYQGPDLANKLIGVLIRFRQDSIAFMADIEAMFNQVKVHQDDRDVLRFLWWPENDFKSPPDVYRMTTHLFGGVWSPSCANFALRKVAEENTANFDEETINTVHHNFYVDDCLKSLSTNANAIKLIHQLRRLLSLRGFHLTKFISNSKEVLQSLPDTTLSGTASLDLDKSCAPSHRALGILWNTEDDCFMFDSHVKENPFTKRGLLSTMSSVYDPLGFLAPFVLPAKRIFQSLCRDKIDWDDVIPDSYTSQWLRWLDDLNRIKELKIPRCLKGIQPTTAQLHHFSDASEYAIGAVTYLRLVDNNGYIHCSLVMAKSKLAPIKTTTIPRLELTAAVISVKLDLLLREHIEIPLVESIYWTDSTIVLHYIRNSERRYQTFVANRVAEIRNHTHSENWRHVDSQLNPADDVSRGMTAKELCESSRWIKGPSFLWKTSDQWPTQPALDYSLDTELEIKKQHIMYGIQCGDVDTVEKLVTKYSSWHKLQRAVAWWLRLKQILLGKKFMPSKYLNASELEAAEKALLIFAQGSFSQEQLQSMEKLSPVKMDGLIVVGGRLFNSPIDVYAKHQILLPANHHITDLIIRHFHLHSGHGGIERTLAETRQKYWITKGRSLIRKIIRNCMTCQRYKAPQETQLMADLPEDRVTPNEPPFSNTGVDYFGPFAVKRGRSEVKRYGCIFTCMSTRAVHIEVAHSLDTDSFINALQRFIARRGKPSHIRSDNGTNFVGANNEMKSAIKEWNKDKIHCHLLQQGIDWHFNTPTASHMGGTWERQVRTIRRLMYNLVQHQILTDESLATLMCIIESIINSRPITKLSDDPNDAQPLTPNHLLLLRANSHLPPGKFVQEDSYRRRWRQIQYLADLFWTRWTKEYLPTLQKRQKWIKPRRNIGVGDLVLLVDEGMPRNQWPLGLITAVYPGKDGFVRSVQVKCRNGTYQRPVTKLCLLESNYK